MLAQWPMISMRRVVQRVHKSLYKVDNPRVHRLTFLGANRLVAPLYILSPAQTSNKSTDIILFAIRETHVYIHRMPPRSKSDLNFYKDGEATEGDAASRTAQEEGLEILLHRLLSLQPQLRLQRAFGSSQTEAHWRTSIPLPLQKTTLSTGQTSVTMREG